VKGQAAPARPTPHPLDIIEATFVGGYALGGSPPPPTYVEVALAGRSNVGKSSLANCLVQRRGLVRTSKTPGCTRQVNLFEVTSRDGAKCVLADLPGYGFARRSKDERKAWAGLIESYLTTRPVLRALCILVDGRRGVEEDDLELALFARDSRRGDLPPLSVILVATKADKIPSSEKRSALDAIRRAAGARVVGFSSVTGEGRLELWKAIRSALSIADRVEPVP